MGLGEQIRGEDHCWLHRDNLRGHEWGAPQLGMLLEEEWSALEMRHHCWVVYKPWSCHCRLSPHMPVPASRGSGRDSHQSEGAPVCCNFLLVSATTGTSHMPTCGCLIPPWPEWVSVPQSATAFTPSCLGTDCWLWPTHRGGAKTKAEPQVLYD